MTNANEGATPPSTTNEPAASIRTPTPPKKSGRTRKSVERVWRVLKNKERFPKTDRSLGLITKAFLLLILGLVVLASWANNPLEYTGWGARETFALVATVFCLGAANSMIDSAASKDELSELGPWDAAGLVGTVAGAAAALEIVTVALVDVVGRIIA